jgi:hypothetical protein
MDNVSTRAFGFKDTGKDKAVASSYRPGIRMKETTIRIYARE